MKKVMWKGPERMIPGVGMGREGCELNLPDEQADSYVSQGLAEHVKIGSKKTTNQKEDN